MLYFLLSLLIFLSPFIINPFGGYFFEPPKVIVVEVLIELILVITLFKNSSFFKSLNLYQLTLSAVLVILTIIHLFVIKNSVILFGNEVRLQGIFLLWHLISLLLIGSRLDLGKLPRVLFPVCLLFLLITAFLVEPDENGRAIATLGEANALAASAIFFWPFAFTINIKNSLVNNSVKIGILLATSVIILLSGSRSGALAFILQIIFLISVRWLNLKKAVLLGILLILLTLVLPFIKGGGWYENRSEIWVTAIVAGGQNLLGHGFGNIENGLYETSLKLGNNIKYQSVDSSHNFLLDFWVQGGIIGLSAILGIILLSLKGLVKNLKVIEITVFLGLISVLLFNPTSVATLVVFWFILGQGFRGYN